MSEQKTTELTKWFVLIGVDYYMPGNSRTNIDGSPLRYPNLLGCVSDIGRLQNHIEKTQNVDQSHIVTFTSSPNSTDPNKPKEDMTKWPTYDNIVQQLQTVTNTAQPGDIVHIHHSGHGARAKTVYPELKGLNGLDEAIVPCDIRCKGRYLRDFELAALLDTMVQKRLIVTVVLDSSSSALDYTVLSSDKSDIPRELLASVRSRYRDTDRTPKESWLLEAEGYELLTACRLDENSNEVEDRDQDDIWHGALTYCLLESIRLGGANLTHGMLHRRIRAEVQIDFPRQTPIFAGNSKRVLFSNEERHHASTIPVKSVNPKGYLILGAGKAHGISKDSEYDIYPWDHDFSDSISSPRVQITEVFDLKSQAQLSCGNIRTIKPGFQAVPRKTPVQKLVVKLVHDPSDESKQAKLNQLQQHLCSNVDDLPVELISDDSAGNGTFHLGVNIDGRYILLDTSGQEIPTFPPSEEPELVLHRLSHLAKYEMIRELKNPNIPDMLDGKFTFELVDPTYEPTNPFTIRDGGAVYIRFKNETKEAVNLTIFDFQPLWGITQIYPLKSDFETILAGEERKPEFRMTIPEQLGPISAASDVLKAFVTIQGTSFRSLELPDMEREQTRGYPSNRDHDALEQLLNTLDVPHRGRGPSKRSPGIWATSEITIRIIRDNFAKNLLLVGQ
ncbi:caspase domain-containing protein [Trichophaea hybrida]|nr:caspase domain-containing protein [Trichophaea hybrida]